MSGRISVVVPIYNVEAYLAECLDSIAQQTLRDLEIVLVDDGSTDSSPDIAASYADRDDRFLVVTKPNGGLGSARNAGLDKATGELMMFVDSDDVIPPEAIATLCAAMDETGSDFATGNVWRLRERGLEPSKWLAPVFAETRLRSHVTRFPLLVHDRVAWNKLWRRTFWDEHGFRFPEGMLHEDMPVTIPAHFLARSVDVISDPIYYWRARSGSNRSITQRRVEVRSIADRMTATQSVRDFLRNHPVPDALHRYDASVLEDDLPPYIDLLLRADDDYRREFVELINAMLDDADADILDELPEDLRIKWLLVRERRLDDLLALLTQQKAAKASPRGTSTRSATLSRRALRRVPRPFRRLLPAALRRRIIRYDR